jgi:hypothetical protein
MGYGATYFYDDEDNKLGSDSGVLPITLYKGMKFTIHGHERTFEVVEWSYHYGHQDEDAGLKIILRHPLTPDPKDLVAFIEPAE